jgi:hypothetical protein
VTLPAIAVPAAVQARLGVSLPHGRGRAHVPPRATDALQAIGVRRQHATAGTRVQPKTASRVRHDAAGRVDGAGSHIGWPCLGRRFYGAPSVRGDGFWRYGASAGDEDEAEQDTHVPRVPMGGFGDKVNGWEGLWP